MSYQNGFLYKLHELSQKFVAESDQILKERFGVGFSQLKVLLCLEDQPGLAQNEIAKRLMQTEASISRQITILYKKKLISIKTGRDIRANMIYPTPRGMEVVYKSTKALNDRYDSMLMNLGSKQQKALSEALAELDKYLTS